MAWVTIQGHRYYRRSRRVQGRVVTQHIGGGEYGQVVAQVDDASRLKRRIQAELKRVERESFLFQVQNASDIDQFLSDLFTLLAVRCGFYQHRRQWRRTRRANPMILGLQLDMLRTQLDVEQQRRAPLRAPDFSGIPKEDRKILKAAAKGDKEALEKAQPYLSDPKLIQKWGDPMLSSRCWLVSQVAGDNLVVAHATHARMKLMREELGFEQANMLEKIAITRIVHNWLAVSALEARACRTDWPSPVPVSLLSAGRTRGTGGKI